MTENTSSFRVERLDSGDYEEERAFLTRCRKALPRKVFFYPYTDEQLRAVMDGGEAFAIRIGGKLAATFNIDLDADYAAQLAAGIAECTSAVSTDACFEASGLMVDAKYRGKGLAGKLADAVVARAEELGIDLCGVVHHLNIASLNTFLSRKFVVAGVFELNKRYIFLYLLKKCEFSFEIVEECAKINIANIEGIREQLRRGNVGIGSDGEDLLFSKIRPRVLK